MSDLNRAVATGLAGSYQPRRYDVDANGFPSVSLNPIPYHGRHRADERCACGSFDCEGAPPSRTTERPPSPTYSFTLVEQPGGGA